MAETAPSSRRRTVAAVVLAAMSVAACDGGDVAGIRNSSGAPVTVTVWFEPAAFADGGGPRCPVGPVEGLGLRRHEAGARRAAQWVVPPSLELDAAVCVASMTVPHGWTLGLLALPGSKLCSASPAGGAAGRPVPPLRAVEIVTLAGVARFEGTDARRVFRWTRARCVLSIESR